MLQPERKRNLRVGQRKIRICLLTDENIIEAVCPSILTLDDTNEDELEDDQGQPEEIVPYSSAIKSLELIELYLSQNNVEEAESVSNSLRKMLQIAKANPTKQTSIIDFFKRS